MKAVIAIADKLHNAWIQPHYGMFIHTAAFMCDTVYSLPYLFLEALPGST